MSVFSGSSLILGTFCSHFIQKAETQRDRRRGERETFHLLVHSLDACNNITELAQSQEPGTQSRSPHVGSKDHPLLCKVHSHRMLESEVEPKLKPKLSNVGCRNFLQHLSHCTEYCSPWKQNNRQKTSLSLLLGVGSLCFLRPC